MFPYFSIDPRLQELSRQAEEEIRPQFEKIEEVQRYNQQKMLAAFNRAGVSESPLCRQHRLRLRATGAGTCWMRCTPTPWGRRTPWCAITLSAVPTP